MNGAPISRQDIEDRFRQVQKDITGEKDTSTPVAVAAGAIGGAVALAIMFGAGRVAGRTRRLLPGRRA